MSFLFDNIPLTRCYVRGEYLRDLKRGHGEWVPGVAHAVRCVRGHSLHFQVALMEPYGGAQFLLPIQALTWREDAPERPVQELQPWDCLGNTFSVVELRFIARGGVQVLPSRMRGQYRFSIDYGCEDLADDPSQHKTLHCVWREDGNFGAYPNNRILFEDPAFWDVLDERPDFEALSLESRAEGMPVNTVKEAAE